MNVEILPSAVGARHQFLSSYLINETVAIDAGSLGLMDCLERQSRVEHVFLSHSHIDHIASLPIFLDNVFTPGPKCPQVYGSASTLASLREDVFNDRVWPDFERLSTDENRFVQFNECRPSDRIEASDLTVSTLALEHVVPTLGFVADDGTSRVAMISDTVPCDALRELLAGAQTLSGLFLECSFPDELGSLAAISKHLTPSGFARLVAEVPHSLPIVVTHVKPSHFDVTIEQLTAIGRPSIQVGEAGRVYSF